VATSREWESRESPPDWVYVNNFVNATKPVAIELSAGQAPKFNHALRGLIEDLKTALPAVFQSEDYQRRRGAACVTAGSTLSASAMHGGGGGHGGFGHAAARSRPQSGRSGARS
jgi:hypothetical protein